MVENLKRILEEGQSCPVRVVREKRAGTCLEVQTINKRPSPLLGGILDVVQSFFSSNPHYIYDLPRISIRFSTTTFITAYCNVFR